MHRSRFTRFLRLRDVAEDMAAQYGRSVIVHDLLVPVALSWRPSGVGDSSKQSFLIGKCTDESNVFVVLSLLEQPTTTLGSYGSFESKARAWGAQEQPQLLIPTQAPDSHRVVLYECQSLFWPLDNTFRQLSRRVNRVG